jgi:hypothetical protein
VNLLATRVTSVRATLNDTSRRSHVASALLLVVIGMFRGAFRDSQVPELVSVPDIATRLGRRKILNIRTRARWGKRVVGNCEVLV